MRSRQSAGQSTVEMAALLPLLVLLTWGGWQSISWAAAWTRAVGAAEAGVRAERVHRSGAAAARELLAPADRAGVRVEAANVAGGTPTVIVQIPVAVLGGRPATLTARSDP